MTLNDQPAQLGPDITPIEKDGSKNRMVKKGHMMYLKPSNWLYGAVWILRVMIIAFWGSVIYNIYTLNFILFDELWLFFSILWTLVYYFIGILFSLYSLILTAKYKAKEYFDNKNGVYKIYQPEEDTDLNNEISDISSLQLIGYQKYHTERYYSKNSGSTSAVVLTAIFQLIIITSKGERKLVANFVKRSNAIRQSRRLSKFINKPLLNYTDHLESNDEAESKIGKMISSRHILHSTFKTKMCKKDILEEIEAADFSAKSLSKNTYILQKKQHYDTNFYGKHLPAKIKLTLEEFQEGTSISLKSIFRYEFLVYLGITLLISYILDWDNPYIHVLFIFLGIGWYFYRMYEKTNMAAIVELLVEEKEKLPILNPEYLHKKDKV
ncbi:hypothetical protein GCM10022393_05280 [Aquimarina addita]|uniref:Uncharacterized protein n=1 Tax=Aquimarina addita TaxID=870485 RepID=A0ABP7XA65_9FLAO